MRRSLFLCALLLFMALSSSEAHAKLFFGDRESIHFLEDLKLKGPKGESLYLGYMTTMHCFLLPYSLSTTGYVLGVKGESDRYYKLPEDRVAQLQQAGMLPNPLPRYRFTSVDYLLGYSLWPALALIAILTPFSRRRHEAASQARAA